MKDGETELDLTGLKCPMPALLLRRALRNARSGQVIVASATDPLAEIDLPFAAGQADAAVLSVTSTNGIVRIRVQK